MPAFIAKFVLLATFNIVPAASIGIPHVNQDEILKVHDGSDAPFVDCVQNGGEVIYLQSGGRVCAR